MTFPVVIVRVSFGTAVPPARVKFVISFGALVTGPVIEMGVTGRTAVPLACRIEGIPGRTTCLSGGLPGMTLPVIIIRVFPGAAVPFTRVKFVIAIGALMAGLIIVIRVAGRAAVALAGRVYRIAVTTRSGSGTVGTKKSIRRVIKAATGQNAEKNDARQSPET